MMFDDDNGPVLAPRKEAIGASYQFGSHVKELIPH